MTSTTFYPDDPAGGVDGTINNGRDFSTWDTLHDGSVGTSVNTTEVDMILAYAAANVSNQWHNIYRVIIVFNTAGLPDGDVIPAVDFGIVGGNSTNSNPYTDYITIVASAPASNTNIVVGDYDSLGSARYAPDLLHSSFTDDASTFNTFAFNATGIANVSKTGATKIGIRYKADTDDVEPTWQSGLANVIYFLPAEEVASGDKRPRLVVTHAEPPEGNPLLMFGVGR